MLTLMRLAWKSGVHGRDVTLLLAVYPHLHKVSSVYEQRTMSHGDH
jgi:hypothetical protein